MNKYQGNEKIYINRILEGKKWSATSGSWNHMLELKMKEKFGVKYAVAYNSGTSTLHAALIAIGVKPGDEIITPALTVFMDTSAILHAFAIPVYCDVDLQTFLINPKELERKITLKTKAIICVALYGLSPEYDEIQRIAKKYNIPIIEDNAQAVLSFYKGKILGGIGDISSFSFENSKHISCGEGGMILTNNEEYALLTRKVGGHGFVNLTAEEGRVKLNQEVFQSPDYKRHDSIGWNYRLSEFQAAIALAQLERVEELVENRQEVANIFLKIIRKSDLFIEQAVPQYCIHSYYTLALRYVGEEKYGINWKEFYSLYKRNGGDGFYAAWSVPYLEPVMSEGIFKESSREIYENVNYEQGICPIAEKLQKQIMQFKTNYNEIDKIYEQALILDKTIKEIENKLKDNKLS